MNPDIPIPDLIRNVVVDKATSLASAQAITAALFARERGAGGQHINVPMLDVSLFLFWPDGMMKHTFVGEAERQGPALYDVYRIWPTADGHLIYFAASESEFHGLFRALGHPEWCDNPRFNFMHLNANPDAREELGGKLRDAIAAWPTKDLVQRMAEEQVPVGPVNTIEDMLVDPQVLHNDVVFEWEHPTAGKLRQVHPAARFSKTPQKAGRMPPLHGEHTAEVLGELGFDAAAQISLRAEGVIP